MSFVSYAQNFEDVMLWRALKNVPDGFYIDIGAQDPVKCSVSLGFHLRGWGGSTSSPYLVARQLSGGSVPAIWFLRQQSASWKAAFASSSFPMPTASVPATRISRRSVGLKALLSEREIPCLPLSQLFDRHVRREVHWLKIDVEGYEGAVIRSWRPSMVRPWLVVIESTEPRTQINAYSAWEAGLLALGYRFVYFRRSQPILRF